VFACDEDFSGLEDGAGVDLEEAGGVEDDGRRSGLLAGAIQSRERARGAERKGMVTRSNHGYDYSNCRFFSNRR